MSYVIASTVGPKAMYVSLVCKYSEYHEINEMCCTQYALITANAHATKQDTLCFVIAVTLLLHKILPPEKE